MLQSLFAYKYTHYGLHNLKFQSLINFGFQKKLYCVVHSLVQNKEKSVFHFYALIVKRKVYSEL